LTEAAETIDWATSMPSLKQLAVDSYLAEYRAIACNRREWRAMPDEDEYYVCAIAL